MKGDIFMTKETQSFVTEKLHELMNAPSCCAEAKAAAQAWLDALGTDKQADMTEKLIAELEEDIMPIDTLITFSGSEAGVKVFGEEMAKQINAHGREIKAAGAKYCDCPACTAVAAILAKKEDMTV